MNLATLKIGALGLGGIGCLLGFVLAPRSLARAWLVADHVIMGLSLGAVTILLIHRLTGGLWGEAIGPQLRRIAATLPLALLGFLPLLGMIETLMPFLSQPEADLPVGVVRKLGYLTPFWLMVRALVCAAVFMAVAWLAGTCQPPRRLAPRPAATIGLVLYALALTIFSTDWMMALEPEFTSTIYPVLVAGSQILGALALATTLHLFAAGLRRETGGSEVATLSGDLSKLLISAILAWVYLAYMQWLIVWMGNLPEEIGWYLRRDNGCWPALFWLMAALFALVPFLALLLGAVRISAPRVAVVASLLVAGYVAETVWRLGGAHAADGAFGPLIIAALLVIGSACALVPTWLWGMGATSHA